MTRRTYPSDIDEDMYHFMVPYVVLKPEHAAQRKYPLREVLDLLRKSRAKLAAWSETV